VVYSVRQVTNKAPPSWFDRRCGGDGSGSSGGVGGIVGGGKSDIGAAGAAAVGTMCATTIACSKGRRKPAALAAAALVGLTLALANDFLGIVSLCGAAALNERRSDDPLIRS